MNAHDAGGIYGAADSVHFMIPMPTMNAGKFPPSGFWIMNVLIPANISLREDCNPAARNETSKRKWRLRHFSKNNCDIHFG